MGEDTPKKIIPTVGRVVYYKDITIYPGQEVVDTFAAIITRVHNENLVNLAVFKDTETVFKTSVANGDGVNLWDWMPFQKASASNSQSAEPRPIALTPIV